MVENFPVSEFCKRKAENVFLILLIQQMAKISSYIIFQDLVKDSKTKISILVRNIVFKVVQKETAWCETRWLHVN